MALTTGLQAYYKFDEGTGSTAGDSVGSNDGTINGASWTTGKINSGLSFDGTNDYVDISSSITSSISGANARTINLWINPATNTVRYMPFSYGLNSNGENFVIECHDRGNGQTWNFNGWGGTYIFYTDLPVTTGFQMMTYVYTGTKIKIYKNGVEAGEYKRSLGGVLTNNVTLDTEQTNINIGRRLNGTDDWFDGIIDEVGIWNRALISTEITELYNSGAGLQYPFTPTAQGNFFTMF